VIPQFAGLLQEINEMAESPREEKIKEFTLLKKMNVKREMIREREFHSFSKIFIKEFIIKLFSSHSAHT